MELKRILEIVEGSRSAMISDISGMIRIPAIGPSNGGAGELERADHVQTLLKGFDSVERYDTPDRSYPDVIRPNIVARRKGAGKGTVWIVSHLDTVPPGDLGKWISPPFEPRVDGGRVYGLGTEDNGQAIISSIHAVKAIPPGRLSGKSIGLAIVADEETTSAMGIEYLLGKGCFTEDDLIIVPDWGSEGGTMIEIAEKHLLWVRFTVRGRQTHGSVPEKGINAFRVGTDFLSDLMARLKERYGEENAYFRPPTSTFEPTKASPTVDNVNTIPGLYEFWMDCRILPSQDPEEILGMMRAVAGEHSERTGAEISAEVEQKTFAGKPSATDTEDFKVFLEAVRSVADGDVETVGVGGGTCANFFRLRGLNAYVWQFGGGSLHQPNEYVVLDNIVNDAKVYATVFYRLCV
ncbi:MAG: M20 family metallo-hydrolase [Thermoplasmatales archaeon]|jgi:succinyl-diaminopimelate desuccinylase|nr:M20 family metallo-hydrolase [Thermoplasmatales archaeon]